MGLREVTKHLKLNQLKCIIISPNMERIQSKGICVFRLYRFIVTEYTVFLCSQQLPIYRSTLRQSRPNNAGLKCPSIHAYVCVYIHPSTKSFFNFNEIWRLGRGQ